MKPRLCLTILLVIPLVIYILLLKWPANQPMVEQITNMQTNEPSFAVAISNPAVLPNARALANLHQETLVRAEQAKSNSEQEIAMWQAPIQYFGKVVDENSQPITGVQVSYNASAMDTVRKEIQYTGLVSTDERGMFKIDGVNGVNLMLELSHPSYYAYPDNSTGFDKRSLPKKGFFSDCEERAESFRMHSKGHPVLLSHRRGGVDVPVNGGSAMVEFLGQQDKDVVGTLQIEASGNTPKNWSPKPYDWSVRLTVPNGGLVESTNQFDFNAPDSGYQRSIEIDMGQDQQGWSDTVDKSYFLKFQNVFARMKIHMRAKTPLYVSLEYFVNTDGTTNLEPQ